MRARLAVLGLVGMGLLLGPLTAGLGQPKKLSQKEFDESYACFDTEDFREGVAAFLAKRKPNFKGK